MFQGSFRGRADEQTLPAVARYSAHHNDVGVDLTCKLRQFLMGEARNQVRFVFVYIVESDDFVESPFVLFAHLFFDFVERQGNRDVGIGSCRGDGNARVERMECADFAVARFGQRTRRYQYFIVERSGFVVLVQRIDRFINQTRPFSMAKAPDDASVISGLNNAEALPRVLAACAEALRVASILLGPVMPEKMAELWRNWNCAPPPGATLEELCVFGGEHALKPGQQISKGEALFMRADPDEDKPGSGGSCTG